MNPFTLKPMNMADGFMDWNQMYPKSYDKNEIDPYTRDRVILMNGTEFEAVWFSHQFSRHETCNDLRRELAVVRRQEQQQQKKISNLKPLNENLLEHTIGYEQLAVDLTAALAQCEKDASVKSALDFALLEDFDHLYRYADLLEMEQGIKAEKLVGHYTEIMPGRPTISEHRYPFDALPAPVDFKTADIGTRLHVGIITAAEQQTMNYYMNVGTFYTSDLGRRLYQEIALIEEQHVTQYGGLLDVKCTWLESWVMHEYTEAYLYWSVMQDETDPYIKKVWEQCFDMEVSHLHKAAQLLAQRENKQWQQVVGNGDFPQPLKFKSNIDYVRGVMNMVEFSAEKEIYKPVNMLPRDYEFFKYQNKVNHDTGTVPSHQVIDMYIRQKGQDYRWETAPNPIPELQNRKADNTRVGRTVQ